MDSKVSYEITYEDIKQMHLQFLNYKIIYTVGIASVIVGTFLLGIQVLSFIIRVLESGIFDSDIIFWGIVYSLFVIFGIEYLAIIYFRYKNTLELKKDYPELFNVILTFKDNELIYESYGGQNRLVIKKPLVKRIMTSKNFIFIVTKVANSIFIVKRHLNNDQINKVIALREK